MQKAISSLIQYHQGCYLNYKMFEEHMGTAHLVLVAPNNQELGIFGKATYYSGFFFFPSFLKKN